MSKSKSFFKYIVFAVVLLIPFIYSFFYLKAYWDPYGNIENVPVALVNEDRGDKGAKVVDKLLEDKVLDFEKTNAEVAKEGLKNKKYYATITFPSNFTANLESADTNDKIPAQIEYSPNQKSNYLASQIINRVVLGVETSVRSEVADTVVGTLSDKLEEVPGKLEQISAGATQLQSGANQLSNGLYTLDSKYTLFDNGIGAVTTGSTTLHNGLVALNSGLNNLKDGANALDDGIAKINAALKNLDTSKLETLKTGITALDNGATTINDGANTMAEKVKQYTTGAEQLAGGVQALNASFEEELSALPAQIAQLKAGIAQTDSSDTQTIASLESQLAQAQITFDTLSSLLADSNYKALVAGSQSFTETETYQGITSGQALSVGASALAEGATNLKNGTSALAAGVSELDALSTSLNTLKEKLAEVGQGTTELLAGAEQLQNGAEQLTTGSTTLNSGLDELKTSSSTIKNGINSLDNGSFTLSNGINTLKNSVEQGTVTTKNQLTKLDGLSKFAANPVEVKETDMGQVDEYGVSFTPLFISIGLWVGALMSYIVLFFDQDHRFGFFDKTNRSLKQSAVYVGIAAGFGLITAFLLKTFIGFSVVDVPGYYFGAILISATFMAIIQCLITLFGDAGKLFALIILVLQLAAAGGTFPIETVDSAFRWLNPLLPMTYSINLIKENTISTDGLSSGNIAVLFGFLIVNFGLTAIYYLFFHQKTKSPKK